MPFDFPTYDGSSDQPPAQEPLPGFPTTGGGEFAGSITIDTVPSIPDLNASFIQDPSSYTEYNMTVSYQKLTGLKGVLIHGPIGTQGDVVRLHAPACKKIVTWSARRVGAPPIAPSTDTGCANDVLEESVIGDSVPGLTIGGDKIWTRGGTYVYFLIQPPDLTVDNLSVGSGPYDQTSAILSYISPNDFSLTIHGPATAPTGAPTTPIGF